MPQAMTAETVKTMLEGAGARVATREGRSDSYGAPRDFSFQVKAIFGNGLELQVVARQFNYRDPWETSGRVNDLVDVSLLREGSYSPLPKGYPFFQGTDVEEGIDSEMLAAIVETVAGVNPKVYILQELTGDL